jgi:hypothetical protein
MSIYVVVMRRFELSPALLKLKALLIASFATAQNSDVVISLPGIITWANILACHDPTHAGRVVRICDKNLKVFGSAASSC